jgi:3,5-epimerase/4-reductase
MAVAENKILIIGQGYIGQRCAEAWPEAKTSAQRIESVADALAVIDEFKPASVLNAAGIVGKPNVDWCDEHPWETIAGNTILPLQIARACQLRKTYLLHIGSGCVYYGQSPDSKGWRENDFANPEPAYTRAKYAADLTLATLPNVGIARIRMPLDSRPGDKNIVDKLVSYPKILDVKNSLTVVDDMIDVFRQLLEKQATGIFHVTNPGYISHREIIDLYRQLVDSNLPAKEWLSEDDLVKKRLAKKKRSSNILQSENLEKLGIKMRPSKEAVRKALQKYTQIKKSNQL